MHLIDTIMNQHLSSAEMLLAVEQRLRANPEEAHQADEHGETPLYCAATYGYTNIVEALIKAGANANQADAHGRTPLYFAATYGYTNIVEALITAGANANQADKNGDTPLYFAAAYGYTKIVEALIKAGANANLAADDGQTPLLQAAHHGHTEIAQALIDTGADANQADKAGNTSLHWAAHAGHTRTVNALLATPGILVNLVDAMHRTPLELHLDRVRSNATRSELPLETYQAVQQTFALFLEKGADLDAVLQRLDLTAHAASIRAGNLLAGLILAPDQDALIRNFIGRGQSTHDPMVHTTAYLSGRELRRRYGATLSEERVLLLQQELLEAAVRHNAQAPTKAFLAKMRSEGDKDIPYWSGGLTMRQAVVCAWLAIHDEKIRYHDCADLKKDIAHAEETFFNAVKQSVAENQCVRGGYFNQLIAACAASLVPGVYLVRMKQEIGAVVKDLLLGKLEARSAFALLPANERDEVLADERAYRRFIFQLNGNFGVCTAFGNNQQEIVDSAYLAREAREPAWMWLEPDELSTITNQLGWSHAEFKAAWEASQPIQPPSETETHHHELQDWIKIIQSGNLQSVWERMADYYAARLAQLKQGKETEESVRTLLTQDQATLTKALADKVPDNCIEDFFDAKLAELDGLSSVAAKPPALTLRETAPEIRRRTPEVAERHAPSLHR